MTVLLVAGALALIAYGARALDRFERDLEASYAGTDPLRAWDVAPRLDRVGLLDLPWFDGIDEEAALQALDEIQALPEVAS